jgi:hypothetical protein
MLTEACPSISDTTLGLTSFESKRVAQVWRRSWNLICGSLARFRSDANDRLRRLVGLMSVPTLLAKTSGRPDTPC